MIPRVSRYHARARRNYESTIPIDSALQDNTRNMLCLAQIDLIPFRIAGIYECAAKKKHVRVGLSLF